MYVGARVRVGMGVTVGCGVMLGDITEEDGAFGSGSDQAVGNRLGVGTGLGLSICYEKIHDMGGDIEVETELNEGTCFTLSFPLEQRSAERLSVT